MYFNSNSWLLVYPHDHGGMKECTPGRGPGKPKASEVNMLRIHLSHHLERLRIATVRFEERALRKVEGALEAAAAKCGSGGRLGPGSISQSKELQVKDQSLKGQDDAGKYK